MVIDDLMPVYDFVERHRIVVNAPALRAYEAVRFRDFARSKLVRLLFWLRGLPRNCTTIQGLLDNGFVLLRDVPGEELVLGLAGKFWEPAGGLHKSIDANNFREFEESGYAKAVWSFSFEDLPTNSTRVATETRIRCADAVSRRRFGAYWILIGPFSALIRRHILRDLKRMVER